jgi:hypothetical protein
MGNKTEDQTLTNLELFVLARLACSKGANEDELTEAVAKLAPPMGPRSPRDHAIEALRVLRDRSLATRPRQAASKRASRPRSNATNEGHRVLQATFGYHVKPRWNTFQDQHLPALALELPTTSEQAKKLGRAHELRLAVLQRYLKIPEATTIDALCAALLAKESRDVRSDDKRSLRQVLGCHWAYRVLASPRSNSDSVATAPDAPAPQNPGRTNHAGVRPPLAVSGVPNPPKLGPASPPVVSADRLLILVREAIPRIGDDGRFGPEKVFVSALWHYIEDDGRLPELSLECFKSWLVTANREQLIDLVRADSQGDMNSQLLEESEIVDRGATFHFVIDRQVAVARRGFYAR